MISLLPIVMVEISSHATGESDEAVIRKYPVVLRRKEFDGLEWKASAYEVREEDKEELVCDSSQKLEDSSVRTIVPVVLPRHNEGLMHTTVNARV